MTAAVNPRSARLREIHELLGLAISLWNSIEFGLLVTFTECLEPAPNNTTTGVFWSIRSFDAKLKTTDVAVRGRFAHHDTVVKDWKFLYARCRQAQSRRNDLAHSHAQEIWYLEDGEMTCTTHLAPAGMSWMTQFSVDPSNPPESPVPDPANKISAVELKKISKDFVSLGEDLSSFARRLKKEAS